MRALRYALWPGALAFGLAAELVGQPSLAGLDAATGFALLTLGVVATDKQPRYAVGWILGIAGTAWFLGTIASWAVFLHRGPLAQLILTYPARRMWPVRREERVGVAIAYGYALVISLVGSNIVTITVALLLLGLAVWRYLNGRGLERRARASALAAAAAFATLVATGAIMRLGGAGGGRGLLIAYELVVILVAAGLTADLVWGEWSQALVTALVVDLGEPADSGTLRDRLARLLGDPTLIVGYWVPDQHRYVEESGQPLALPSHDLRRAVRLIDDDGQPLAALIHDPAILDEPELIADITAATRLAVTNARLQAQVRTRMQHVAASRRRLVEAADRQRRQLEHELRDGAERRLAEIAELLSAGGPQLAEVAARLGAARAELRKLARGIHPTTLTDQGISAAVRELAHRSTIPVDVGAPSRRWPLAIEAAAYFVCAEAITNVAKYARASRIRVEVTGDDTHVRIEIADNGTGGADPSRGSGLLGLIDRVDALGGRLTIESQAGLGTRLTAQLPVPIDAGGETFPFGAAPGKDQG